VVKFHLDSLHLCQQLLQLCFLQMGRQTSAACVGVIGIGARSIDADIHLCLRSYRLVR
jgi:hypothetical protein